MRHAGTILIVIRAAVQVFVRQHLDGVAIIGSQMRQGTQAIGAETVPETSPTGLAASC